jgi:Phage Mu protein F like protein
MKDRNESSFAQYIRYGYFLTKEPTKDYITSYYVWRTHEDDKVRTSHAALHGKIFSWNRPPKIGHPGQDYNCRCWAEPYTVSLEEKKGQFVTSDINDNAYTWQSIDFIKHYLNPKNWNVDLAEIGHLGLIIQHAKTFPQEEGLSIFERVENQIFKLARTTKEGNIIGTFERSYNFYGADWKHGGGTVSGTIDGHIKNNGPYIIIVAEIDYFYRDEFVDIFDVLNLFEGEADIGYPYKIKGSWTTRLEAIIRTHPQHSAHPTKNRR